MYYEVPCLNSDGSTVNNFFQWDVGQKISIEVKGCDESYLEIAPEVHFSNSKRKTALVVRSTVSNGDTITASVPNVLLQEPYPLLVYVYLTDLQDKSSQKTILHSEIPVRKRAIPDDYDYVENITKVTAENIKEEIETSTKDARDDAIKTITEKKEDFIATGDALVETAASIKDATQQKYDEAVDTANQIQTTIEADINAMITQNGVTLETMNDGTGVVTLAILVNQS